MRIETLFLDAGGVLVLPNFARIADTLVRHGVPADAPALAAAERRAKRRLDVGETIRSKNDSQRGWLYFNLMLTEAGIPLTQQSDEALAELRRYHEDQNLWEFVPGDVAPALARLRALGLKLVVVSNANGRLRQAFDRLGLSARVDVMLDSFEEGIEKPDPRLFEIALARSGSRRETTVHVGDLYHVDVVGARAAGIEAVLLDPAGLYEGWDCPRVRTLGELVDLLAARVSSRPGENG